MGRDKALLPWPPSTGSAAPSGTLLSAAIERFSPYVDIVLVVAGKNAGELAPIVYANGASLVVNPEPERGQFSSLRAGLQDVLNRGRDAALITLVDRPPVKPATIEALDEAFERAQREWKWAVVPEYQGKHGHPFLAGRELIEAFLKAPASSSARDIEHAHSDKIVYVAVDDPLIALNVDTPEEYAALAPQMVHSK
jgi:molybdenum cofactor cytidylyltransferase